MRRSETALIGLVLLSALMAGYFYQSLPEQLAVHWDAAGNPNGYMPRLWGAFLMPIVIAALAIVFLAIPRIDPLKANIERFRGHYDRFVLVLSAFMLVLQLQGYLWNTGTGYSPTALTGLGLGVIFFLVGDLCESSKRNWFIGIRTPWTLSSDRVWERTNSIGGKLFKACGVLSVVGAFIPSLFVALLVAPVLATAFFAVVYSYVEYGRENSGRKRKGT
jgi:uncharacterized membrane protein